MTNAISKMAFPALFAPAVLGLSTTAAHAQGTSPVPVASADDDIVVTARRREESLQSVPVAVTAFGERALEARGFTSVTDIEQATPGLKFTTGNGGNSGGFNAYIRGVGESDFIVTSDPAVALYLDGVYVARSFGADLDLIGIDRIEVLRGPQGSLFGKNTIGGAINVVTRKPDGTTSIQADVRGGSFNSVRLRAAASIPLTDTLSGSVSALYRRADGWQSVPGLSDGYGNEDNLSVRGQLRWKSAGGTDVLFAADARRQRQNGQPHNTIATNPGAIFPLFFGIFYGPCCELTTNPDRAAARSSYQKDDADAYNLSLTVSVPVGPGTIKSITAYRDAHAFFGRGINSVAPTYYGDLHDEHARQFSQELQYTQTLFDDRVTLLAGLYYFRERSLDRTQLYVAPGLALQPGFPGLLSSFGLPPALVPVFDVNLDFDNRQTTTNYAAFGNATIRLTDRLSLDLGGRYTSERKSFYQSATRIYTRLPLIPQAPNYTLEQDWRAFTPKVTLSFQATPTVLAYATWSQGFRSGGFNGRPTQFPEIGSYAPEHLTSFEAGLKSTLFDGRLTLNLAAFANRYRDQQVQVNTIASDGVTIIARTENAGRSHMRGIEGEARLKVSNAVTLDGSVAYLDSGYDRYVSNGQDLSGLRLRQAPRWTANAGVSLVAPQVGGVIPSLRVDAAYKSRTELDSLNSAFLSQPGYVLGNANLGFDFAGSGLSLRLSVENVTDKRVKVSGFDVLSSFGIVETYYNPPRRWYATLGYRL